MIVVFESPFLASVGSGIGGGDDSGGGGGDDSGGDDATNICP